MSSKHNRSANYGVGNKQTSTILSSGSGGGVGGARSYVISPTNRNTTHSGVFGEPSSRSANHSSVFPPTGAIPPPGATSTSIISSSQSKLNNTASQQHPRQAAPQGGLSLGGGGLGLGGGGGSNWDSLKRGVNANNKASPANGLVGNKYSATTKFSKEPPAGPKITFAHHGGVGGVGGANSTDNDGEQKSSSSPKATVSILKDKNPPSSLLKTSAPRSGPDSMSMYGYKPKEPTTVVAPIDPDAPMTDAFSWDQNLIDNICTFLPQRSTLRAATVSKRWRSKVLDGFNPREAVEKEKAMISYAEKLKEDTQGVFVGQSFFVIQNIGLSLILGCSFANATASADEDTNTTLALAVAFFGMIIIISVGVFAFCAAGNTGCRNVLREMMIQMAVVVVISIIMFPISLMWEDYRIVAAPLLEAGETATCGSALDERYVAQVSVPALWSLNGTWSAGPSDQYIGNRYLPTRYFIPIGGGSSNGTTTTNSSSSPIPFSSGECLPWIHLLPGQVMDALTTGGGYTPIRRVIARGLWWKQTPAIKELYREHFLDHPEIPLLDMDLEGSDATPGALLTGILIVYLICFLGVLGAGGYFVMVSVGRSQMVSRLDTYENDVRRNKESRDRWHKKMKHGEVFDDVKAEEMREQAKNLKPGQAIVNVGGWTNEK